MHREGLAGSIIIITTTAANFPPGQASRARCRPHHNATHPIAAPVKGQVNSPLSPVERQSHPAHYLDCPVCYYFLCWGAKERWWWVVVGGGGLVHMPVRSGDVDSGLEVIVPAFVITFQLIISSSLCSIDKTSMDKHTDFCKSALSPSRWRRGSGVNS